MDLPLPVVGLSSERQRLLEALRKRESALLLGPPGCGKTTVIRAALEASDAGAVYVPYRRVLHEFLATLARALLESRHAALLRLSGVKPDDVKWVERQTSLRLKGLLWGALEPEPRTLVLDGVEGPGPGAFRFLQRLLHCPGMAILAAARDLRSLGALARLFWDPLKTIQFQPLAAREARRLFDLAAQCFGLQRLALDDFREQVLQSARGNPGQIVAMCRLATDARYLSGRHIKFAPLRIDAIVKFMG
jgi:hypothetical protein